MVVTQKQETQVFLFIDRHICHIPSQAADSGPNSLFFMIVVRAPFRLPIGGGGTDLPSYYSRHGGYLITAAINKYMYININQPSCIQHISLKYSKTETVDSVNHIKHDLARETLAYLDFHDSIEISSMADTSAGTGMGSSGAYTVGLLKGMNSLLHRFVDKESLAKEACHIEMDRAGEPVGKQDQYASAVGGIFVMEIDRDGEVEVRPLRFSSDLLAELEYRLVVFYTNIQRSASEVLAEQSEKISHPEDRALSAMHEIKAIGRQIEIALRNGDVSVFGKLMNDHWRIKRSISNKMSTKQIDDWYGLALRNGALGGKIMGAGGGGFFVFCCEDGKRRSFIKAMTDAGLIHTDFRFDFEGAKTLVDI